ncbi:MAG: DMT family transporter [Psychrobium sp.]
MKVSASYLAVIIIWSTTPLGIVWSSETVSPTMAVLMRMVIAATLGTLLLITMRIKLPVSPTALKLYGFSTLGLFGGMSCGYMAAPYVSSGFMSLVFGLSPVVTGILAQRILNEPAFDMSKKIAMLICMLGLLVVCWDKLSLNSDSYIGIGLLLVAMFFFSLSGVLVKSVSINIHPLATTLGTLYCAIPLFFAAWLITDGQINVDSWQERSIFAIVYLGIFASLVGFIAYFFVLQRLSTSTVALTTLITPSFAIALGALFNGETISHLLIAGALLITLGLGIYFWGRQFSLQLRKL